MLRAIAPTAGPPLRSGAFPRRAPFAAQAAAIAIAALPPLLVPTTEGLGTVRPDGVRVGRMGGPVRALLRGELLWVRLPLVRLLPRAPGLVYRFVRALLYLAGSFCG